jgi:hypothetical protein
MRVELPEDVSRYWITLRILENGSHSGELALEKAMDLL